MTSLNISQPPFQSTPHRKSPFLLFNPNPHVQTSPSYALNHIRSLLVTFSFPTFIPSVSGCASCHLLSSYSPPLSSIRRVGSRLGCAGYERAPRLCSGIEGMREFARSIAGVFADDKRFPRHGRSIATISTPTFTAISNPSYLLRRIRCTAIFITVVLSMIVVQTDRKSVV